AGIGYVVSTGNLNLKDTCSISETTFVKSTDADLGNTCMIIYNAVQPFIGNMAAWSVNAATLSAMLAAINTFNALISTPAGQISIKAAAGNTIDMQIDAMDAILNGTIDTLMAQFKTTRPSFYNAYFSARKPHHTGIHHSVTFEGFVYDTTG